MWRLRSFVGRIRHCLPACRLTSSPGCQSWLSSAPARTLSLQGSRPAAVVALRPAGGVDFPCRRPRDHRDSFPFAAASYVLHTASWGSLGAHLPPILGRAPPRVLAQPVGVCEETIGQGIHSLWVFLAPGPLPFFSALSSWLPPAEPVVFCCGPAALNSR